MPSTRTTTNQDCMVNGYHLTDSLSVFPWKIHLCGICTVDKVWPGLGILGINSLVLSSRVVDWSLHQDPLVSETSSTLRSNVKHNGRAERSNCARLMQSSQWLLSTAIELDVNHRPK